MIRKEFPLVDKEGRIAEIPNGVAPWLFYKGELYLGRVRESHVHFAKRIWVDDFYREALDESAWGIAYLENLEPKGGIAYISKDLSEDKKEEIRKALMNE